MKKDCRSVTCVEGWNQNCVTCDAGDPSFCLKYRESKTKFCENMDDQIGLRFCQDSSDLDLSKATKTVKPLN